MKRSSEASSAL